MSKPTDQRRKRWILIQDSLSYGGYAMLEEVPEVAALLKERVPRVEMDRLAEWWKTECKRVIAERDALKQDAERWRFVQRCIAQHFQDYGRLTWEHFEGGCVPVFERRHDQDWDDAIDDAMRKVREPQS